MDFSLLDEDEDEEEYWLNKALSKRLNEASPYVAVPYLDGDEMTVWIGGGDHFVFSASSSKITKTNITFVTIDFDASKIDLSLCKQLVEKLRKAKSKSFEEEIQEKYKLDKLSKKALDEISKYESAKKGDWGSWTPNPSKKTKRRKG